MRARVLVPIGLWLLYLAMLISLPTPYLIAIFAGLLPPAAILALTMRGTAPILPRLSIERYTLCALVGGHALIVGVLLYLAAAGMSRLAVWAFTRRIAGLLAAGM